MAIDTLFAAVPTIINATFDKVWVKEIVISAPGLGAVVTSLMAYVAKKGREEGVIADLP